MDSQTLPLERPRDEGGVRRATLKTGSASYMDQRRLKAMTQRVTDPLARTAELFRDFAFSPPLGRAPCHRHRHTDGQFIEFRGGRVLSDRGGCHQWYQRHGIGDTLIVPSRREGDRVRKQRPPPAEDGYIEVIGLAARTETARREDPRATLLARFSHQTIAH